jgi:hypothetical protein
MFVLCPALAGFIMQWLANSSAQCPVNKSRIESRKYLATERTSVSYLFRRVCKIWKSDYYLRHVCLSVRPSVSLPFRMEQIGYHLMDFHEI